MAKFFAKDVQPLAGSKIKITFCVPFAELKRFVERRAQELSQELKIKGFRNGKVPYALVEKTVGREKLLNEGAEKAVRKFYVDKVLDDKIEVIGRPEIKIKKLAWENDFEFEAESAVMPEVKIAGWEKNVKKINQEYKEKKYEAKESEIERELEYLAGQRAKLITVNRAAKTGDQLQVDFEVFRENAVIEGGTARNHPVILGKGNFIPGFEKKLEGAKAGEEKEFELEFPKDYHQKHLASQKAQFKVKIKLVQERQVPEINDDFAGGIGKFKNLEELKKNIREGIEHEWQHRKEQKHQAKIIDELVERTEAELPEILIEREGERMMQELDSSIAQMGLEKKAYFEQLKTTEEKIKEQWKKNEALKRIKAGLALKKIAEEKNLEPDKKEIEERINQIIQYYKTIKDAEKKIDITRLYESVKGELANQKALEYLAGL